MSDAEYWNKLNEGCENRSGQAAGYCQRSWGYGGPEAQWRMYVSFFFDPSVPILQLSFPFRCKTRGNGLYDFEIKLI